MPFDTWWLTMTVPISNEWRHKLRDVSLGKSEQIRLYFLFYGTTNKEKNASFNAQRKNPLSQYHKKQRHSSCVCVWLKSFFARAGMPITNLRYQNFLFYDSLTASLCHISLFSRFFAATSTPRHVERLNFERDELLSLPCACCCSLVLSTKNALKN